MHALNEFNWKERLHAFLLLSVYSLYTFEFKSAQTRPVCVGLYSESLYASCMQALLLVDFKCIVVFYPADVSCSAVPAGAHMCDIS